MTFEKFDEESGPDGFVLVHHPSDGGESYGVGPFPPIEALAALMLASPPCDCRIEVLWLGFPPGIKLAIAVPESVMASLGMAQPDETEGLVN